MWYGAAENVKKEDEYSLFFFYLIWIFPLYQATFVKHNETHAIIPIAWDDANL